MSATNGRKPVTGPTVDGDVDRAGRTRAATAARRRQAAERHAREVAGRVEDLPQPVLAALLVHLLQEAERRKRDREPDE